ncbi:MAG: signal peptidase I [Candidatus Moranbacteria bacterium]|nr:signal peptidase I [Candidatus Moranbacteria bacterium]
MTENEQIEEKQEETYGAGGIFWEMIKIVLWVVLIIVPLRVFLVQPFFVQGASMEPNFEDKEYLIISELGYKTTDVGFDYGEKEINFFTVNPFKEMKRGEVVVFRYPKNPSVYYIKRIVGLQGEKIEIKDNEVKIYNSENPNGFILDESAYLPPAETTSGDQIIQLTSEQYFVMGDNRKYSSDSRSWGPVPVNDIMGRVMLRAWPFGKAAIF